ncbi:Cna B-type domain-containing protein [Corynebacterium sp.]|uniref:Cna B-type domain-containing protein n=1 Tax=Corynebacterium sp. TaxID=1720 RepID=UPI002A914A71|nr:Cna B-type domain-containing protein [Corynebacterium sp.]
MTKFELLGPDGQPTTAVTYQTPYTFNFEFQVPDGTQPGDTFTVVIPEGFTPVEANLGSGNSKAELKGQVVEVTIGNELLGQIGIKGGLSIVANFTENLPEATSGTIEVEFGNEKFYEQINKGAGPPPAPEMAINKWSGYSTHDVNLAKELKLQSPRYNYNWIKPVEGQTMAHWFIELNNFQGELDPVVIGQNIVISDRISGLPADFTPGVEVSQVPQGYNQITEEQVASLLEGTILRNFFTITIREKNEEGGNIDRTFSALEHPSMLEYIDFTDDDGFTFRISEFFNSIEVTASDRAQYALNYYSLVPAKNANVTNVATVETTEHPGSVSDTGWFKTISADGWIWGEQPLTSVVLKKVWSGLGEGETAPQATFELLADGVPAVDINNKPIPRLVLEDGVTEGKWDKLPTQSGRNVPIEYTVKELSVEGWTTEVSGSYTPDLSDLASIPAGEVTVTNSKISPSKPVTTEPTTTEPTTTESTTTTTTEPTTTTTESSTTTTERTTPTSTEPNMPARPRPGASSTATTTPVSGGSTFQGGPTPGGGSESHKTESNTPKGESALANTGANSGALFALAALSILAGAGLIIGRRRTT